MSQSHRRLVSLIMPAWNPRLDWLLQAINSALGQRDCELELIVVDDGSKEPLERMIKSVRDPRLRILRVDHGGVSSALNSGIEVCRGSRIRFIGADDVLEPESTKRLLHLLDDRDDLIAYGATMFCDEKLRPLWKMTCHIEGRALIPCLLGRLTLRVPSILFPRAVVEAIGPWDPILPVSQDWDYVLRGLEFAEARGESKVALYYRKHTGSQTSRRDAGETSGRRVFQRYFDRHPEQRGTVLERRAEASFEAMLARTYLVHGPRSAALRALRRSLKLDARAPLRYMLLSSPALLGFGRRTVRALTFGRSSSA